MMNKKGRTKTAKHPILPQTKLKQFLRAKTAETVKNIIDQQNESWISNYAETSDSDIDIRAKNVKQQRKIAAANS